MCQGLLRVSGEWQAERHSKESKKPGREAGMEGECSNPKTLDLVLQGFLSWEVRPFQSSLPPGAENTS